ncbi:hypothetical protein MXS98_05105 [Escherichia coli]|uniref:hypothetical protein n=1 Tax=Escherichia coli TaxID=562 RepID=UPI0028E141FA|nr:hypothetical protein [Escherichia coli]MDT9472798.1 hypothetical protein [Escherichia coli]
MENNKNGHLGLQVAIRETVSLTPAYKTQFEEREHRLNEAPRRRILQMVQPISWRLWDYSPHNGYFFGS